MVIRNKTYRNFLRVVKILQEEKHYTREESSDLAHKVFENVEADKGYGNRTANWFIDHIVAKEEYEAQYGA